jgi:hypothetical protein
MAEAAPKPVELAFDLVGGWTSPMLYLRLLTIVDHPWEPLRTGFTHRDTGEHVQLLMGPPQPDLPAAIAAGVDPFAPSIDETLIDEIAVHKAVVTVRSAKDDRRGSIERAVTMARAANAAINGGATAIRCRTSGLSHSAEAFQVLAAQVDAAAGDPAALGEALLAIYVLPSLSTTPPSTIGMHALGLPDVSVAASGDPDRDLAKLRALALGVARGTRTVAPAPDARGLDAPRTNPLGLAPPG